MRKPWQDNPRKWVSRGLTATAVIMVAVAILQLTGLLASLNPFGVDTVDRSQPALLRSIRDLSQYHAAAGDYQVVVDVEKDIRFIPAVLAGERTLFVSAGSVNAYIDLSSLATDALTVSEDRKHVQVRLPKAQLDKPNLDHERSYVFSQERGLINRIAALLESPDQQQFYAAAEQKIAAAAQGSELRTRAEKNTRTMLTGMLGALGFQVSFAEPNQRP